MTAVEECGVILVAGTLISAAYEVRLRRGRDGRSSSWNNMVAGELIIYNVDNYVSNR